MTFCGSCVFCAIYGALGVAQYPLVSFWHTIREQKSEVGFIVSDERTKEA